MLFLCQQCNKLCGVGRQSRKVTCHVVENGKTKVLEDDACSDEKPDTEKPCERIPCIGVDWVSSDWSGVSLDNIVIKLKK